jgi:hypothetical protein
MENLVKLLILEERVFWEGDLEIDFLKAKRKLLYLHALR